MFWSFGICGTCNLHLYLGLTLVWPISLALLKEELYSISNFLLKLALNTQLDKMCGLSFCRLYLYRFIFINSISAESLDLLVETCLPYLIRHSALMVQFNDISGIFYVFIPCVAIAHKGFTG